MHTVIILNKHTSDLLKDFRFLFKPFVDEGTISFCDWNESGTDVYTSVPDLYKLIKGKTNWRAVILMTDSMNEKAKYIADEKNPFDYPPEVLDGELPMESKIPLIRLTHILGGYPASNVKNFEKGFEYRDLESGQLVRVRESELTEEAIYALSDKYSDQLKSIYMEEIVPEEFVEAQKRLVEKYTFTDTLPREICIVATRKHRNDEDHIYASWKTNLEMESSNFTVRNRYPSICRFLCYSIVNPENSMYLKELLELWLSVLTLAINKIPASTLQAYKLYRLGAIVSKEEMSEVLNDHLNKMEAVYGFVGERMKMRPEYSFEEEEDLVGVQRVPIIFEGKAGTDLFVETNYIGLSRDCPSDEIQKWHEEVREKQKGVEKYLKSPRRAIDKASTYMKDRTDSFIGDEYELDKFQLADLDEEIQRLEQEILTSDTRSIVDAAKIRRDVRDADRFVRKKMASRMRKSDVLWIGFAALLTYLLGFLPYIFRSAKMGKEELAAALSLAIVTLLVTAMGGLVALIILRKRMRQHMEKFNDVIDDMIVSVTSSAKKFEDYFTSVCTYMKAQSILIGTKLKDDSISSERFVLRAHKNALKACIKRDEELALSYGIKRDVEHIKNVTSFFDETKIPKDNSLYYFAADKSKLGIPVNNTGDEVRTPYAFVDKLLIEREDIFDDMKGDI